MQNCSKTKEYFENSLSHGFLNTITKATRIDGESFSLIDHIFTNKIDRSESGVILSDITDHFLTFISIGPKLRLQKTEPNTFRDFSNINMDRFKMALANLNWHEVSFVMMSIVPTQLFGESFQCFLSYTSRVRCPRKIVVLKK